MQLSSLVYELPCDVTVSCVSIRKFDTTRVAVCTSDVFKQSHVGIAREMSKSILMLPKRDQGTIITTTGN